ncbi:MAG: phosphoribosylglycinamide formyltransferase [Chloroflexi bacterium]|nr:phosphoribosylglycinamide formyltransferase [Chloroflexota bacterium]
MKKRLVVFASGNGSNLQALIDACAQQRLHAEITLVITNRRTAYAAERAAQAGIPHRYEPLRPWLQNGKERADYDAYLAEIVAEQQPHAIVLAGWMHVFADLFIERFYGRILNVHPALLPAFPGAHAISDALAYGVKVTGVTVMYIWPGGLLNYDNGPIILQEVVPVYDDDDEDTLAARIHGVEHRLLPEAVRLHIEEKLEVHGRHVRLRP